MVIVGFDPFPYGSVFGFIYGIAPPNPLQVFETGQERMMVDLHSFRIMMT